MPSWIVKLNYFANKLLLVSLMFLLSGCALTSNNNSIHLTENLALVLTPPPSEKVGEINSHLVEITNKGKSHRFIAQVEYRNNEIAMAAVSPAGVPLFDFRWFDKKETEVNQYVPLPFADIGFIIADMQLCHWPLSMIETSLLGTNVSVSQHDNLSQNQIIWQRTILDNNQVIIKIEKFDDGYELENIIRGYRIRLTNLDKES